MYRCDVALNQFAEPGFLFPELRDTCVRFARAIVAPRRPRSSPIRAWDGCPRTLVNRIWQRLFGRGWWRTPTRWTACHGARSVLDWLASDFVDHGYDIKRLIATILTSRAY